jgi:SSS family solute:Na+ symporter
MKTDLLDWIIIGLFFAISLYIGMRAGKKAGKDAESYFLSGRNMPWWLLGVSMVATTFSADTPNLVTDIVRTQGIAGNWAWWAFLLTGMLTVFVYARMWRRSEVLTDLEFYELRYGGTKAAFLRGFRAVYLGVVFNVLIMATVLLAGIKMGSVLLGLHAWQTLLLCGVITVAYATVGGLRGVLLTDFFQFIIAMIGSIWAAVWIIHLPEVGGLEALMQKSTNLSKTAFFPDFNDPSLYFPVFLAPLLIQWWSVWYPGAEPGGGGYIAQRILASKNETHALKAALFFNVAHYALRPWPWILIALASLLIYPQLTDLSSAFPDIPAKMIKHDLAYPATISLLPKGLLGLVLASLIAALMSTLSTHLNWGASYLTNDVYRRFFRPEASEKNLVLTGKIATMGLMILSAIFALFLSNALQAFQIILQIGAGTGLLFILRWFWWRINAWSEISAMISSFTFALFAEIIWPQMYDYELSFSTKLIVGITFTTLCWVLVTLRTKPEDDATLLKFYHKIRPHTLGWSTFLNKTNTVHLPSGRLSLELWGMLIACIGVYCVLFGTGLFLSSSYSKAIVLLLLATIAFTLLIKKIIPEILSKPYTNHEGSKNL